MLWDETERTAKLCSYIFGGFVAFLGLVSLVVTLQFGDRSAFLPHLMWLGVVAGIMLVWILGAGVVIGVFTGLANGITCCIHSIRKKRRR